MLHLFRRELPYHKGVGSFGIGCSRIQPPIDKIEAYWALSSERQLVPTPLHLRAVSNVTSHRQTCMHDVSIQGRMKKRTAGNCRGSKSNEHKNKQKYKITSDLVRTQTRSFTTVHERQPSQLNTAPHCLCYEKLSLGTMQSCAPACKANSQCLFILPSTYMHAHPSFHNEGLVSYPTNTAEELQHCVRSPSSPFTACQTCSKQRQKLPLQQQLVQRLLLYQ